MEAHNAVGLLGYFTDAAQTEPEFDPGLRTCPVCGEPVTMDDVRTHSIMPVERKRNRSYFYRTHRTCANNHPEKVEKIEGEIADEIFRWEGQQ